MSDSDRPRYFLDPYSDDQLELTKESARELSRIFERLQRASNDLHHKVWGRDIEPESAKWIEMNLRHVVDPLAALLRDIQGGFGEEDDR